MLSSLQALNAAGTAPASRSAAFQPKVKPRAARRGAQAENNNVSTQERADEPSTVAPAPVEVTLEVNPPSTTEVETPTTPAPPVRTLSPRQRHVTATKKVDGPSTSGHSAAPSTKQKQTSGKQPVANPRPAPLNIPSNTPSSSQAAEAQTPETGETSKGKRKRVPSSSAPRKRRVENVDEEIDPTKMTMKEIIRLAEAKDRRKQKEEAANKKQEQQSPSAGKEAEQHQEEHAVPFAPQVEIVDGKIVINQQSLQIDTRELNKVDVGAFRRVEETASKLNYHTYMKKVPRDRWKAEETELFFKAVRQFGTDFAVLEKLLPGKTRRQIKAKYKKEEKDNPRRLSESILQPREDLAHYEELVNRLKTAAASQTAAEDEFDFTWNTNTQPNTQPNNDINEEPGQTADEMATEMDGMDEYENFGSVEDPEYNESSAKKEEYSEVRDESFNEGPSSIPESKQEEETAPSLFAFDMDSSDPFAAYM